MKNRSWLLRVGWLGLVLALTPLNSSTAQEPPALKTPAVPPASDSRFFKLKDLRPGMMGVGHTVFKGDAVSDFQVEILGVVDNFLPKQSAIFARLSGGPLAETGVFAGMSGSPVFVDGKLLGAVAYSFPFSKEAIAAITPIENMVNMTDSSPLRPDKGTAGTSSYAEGPSDGSSQSITNSFGVSFPPPP